ncbi:DUF6318 family protein [Arthrobacter sp. HMSC08H08]|uniref:DUF6318 family protein n=1 Tax=Arthrobacter sp. HMSC08H08 TaxID=1581143 RepID=UPI0008A4A56C|nr:DUF6318 family protein [Arthrobacter sp. HMSC08H08]OFT23203.1 hypothetical protein HMPREF3175_05830 [Arthrobacter sp. HMSC08H08]
MTNLKRSAIATVLTLALASGLTACSNNNEDAKPGEAAPSASPSVNPNNKEAKDENASGSGKESAKSKPSASPSPKGPYKPATSKHRAQNVPPPGPLPKVAREDSKAGQIAFVEHWLKELNYAWEVGSFRKEFWDITSRKCEYCKAANETFSLMKKDNAWAVGGKIRYENIQAPNKKLDSGKFFVTFIAHEGKRSYFRPGKSTAVETTPANSTKNGTFILERKANGWEARGVYGAER